MKPNEKDLLEIQEEIKKAFLETVKRRAVERLLSDNAERLERYYASVSSKVSEQVVTEFPL
jgi:hypothetical protein